MGNQLFIVQSTGWFVQESTWKTQHNQRKSINWTKINGESLDEGKLIFRSIMWGLMRETQSIFDHFHCNRKPTVWFGTDRWEPLRRVKFRLSGSWIWKVLACHVIKIKKNKNIVFEMVIETPLLQRKVGINWNLLCYFLQCRHNSFLFRFEMSCLQVHMPFVAFFFEISNWMLSLYHPYWRQIYDKMIVKISF